MQQAFHEEHALQCGYCTPGHRSCRRPSARPPGRSR
ncbi:2Fe-2S iron-sulfur cluster-binding protein [Streptosporangium sp. NPDC006013]